MANSDFWRELAISFQCVSETHEFSAFRQYYMELRYFLPPSKLEPEWKLEATHLALVEFRPLAIRAATMLTPLPTSDLVVRWLEALWKQETEGPVRSGIPIIGKDRTGRLTQLRGKIDRVFQKSFALCKDFEAETLKIEFEGNRLDIIKEPLSLRPHTTTVSSANPVRELLGHKTEMALREIERQKELEHERKLAEIRASYAAPVSSAPPDIKESTRFRPLDDNYQVVEFDGHQYDLTKIQSTVIRVLHKAKREKRDSVGIQEIQKALGTHSGKMSDWFRGRNHALYNTLVTKTPGSRDHYCINL